MSELKGQLLAMILTLAAFGTIAAVLIPTFQKSAKEVIEKSLSPILTRLAMLKALQLICLKSKK